MSGASRSQREEAKQGSGSRAEPAQRRWALKAEAAAAASDARMASPPQGSARSEDEGGQAAAENGEDGSMKGKKSARDVSADLNIKRTTRRSRSRSHRC